MESGTTRDRFTNVSLDPTSPRYIDTLVNKRIIHRNQANRHKSRLAARVKALSTST